MGHCFTTYHVGTPFYDIPRWDTVLRHTTLGHSFTTYHVGTQFYDIPRWGTVLRHTTLGHSTTSHVGALFYDIPRWDTVLRHTTLGHSFKTYHVGAQFYDIPRWGTVLRHTHVGMQFTIYLGLCRAISFKSPNVHALFVKVYALFVIYVFNVCTLGLVIQCHGIGPLCYTKVTDIHYKMLAVSHLQKNVPNVIHNIIQLIQIVLCVIIIVCLSAGKCVYRHYFSMKTICSYNPNGLRTMLKLEKEKARHCISRNSHKN